MAQRRGGRGGGAGRPAPGISNPDDSKGFQRAIALQATPDQIAQFHKLSEGTEAARKDAQDLRELAEKANSPDLSHYENPLLSAVEGAQNDDEKFLQSFSATQKTELKDLTKKLGKADSDVAKQSKALKDKLGRSKIDDKNVAVATEKLEKALSAFQTSQRAVASEMGIQGDDSHQ
jgi:hypothetical protein